MQRIFIYALALTAAVTTSAAPATADEKIAALEKTVTALQKGVTCKARCAVRPSVFGGTTEYRDRGELSATAATNNVAWQLLDLKCAVAERLTQGWYLAATADDIKRVDPRNTDLTGFKDGRFKLTFYDEKARDWDLTTWYEIPENKRALFCKPN